MSWRGFRTLLIFPPQWSPQNPHGAITAILGHLRAHGKEVIPLDLNVEFFHYLLSEDYLRVALQRLMNSYQLSGYTTILKLIVQEEDPELEEEAQRYIAIEEFLNRHHELLPELPRVIEDVRDVFRTDRFYDPFQLADAFALVDISLQLISLPFHPAQLSFYDYSDPRVPLTTEGLVRATEPEQRDLFSHFFKLQLRRIESFEPDLLAISINSFSQVIPGLMLARILKERRGVDKRPLVIIGGNYFTRLREALEGNELFFKTFCDVVVIGEGERPMLEIVDALERGISLERVGNLVIGEPNPHFTFPSPPERLENLGYQDLEGLPLDKYFTPELVIPIAYSRGCYWGKCSFCDSDFGVHRDQKSLDKLVGEIRYLRDRYGVRHFEFVDEAIHPFKMEEIAKRFIDERLDISWFSNGRLEDEFTFERLKLLRESGLTMILWGFESGSERIMKLINKGVDLRGRWRVLRDADRAGIWNFAYIFFGFPTETREEAMETIRVIAENTDVIHSYGKSIFTLGKHSSLRESGEKYGIIEFIADPEELSTTLYYRTASGMAQEEISEVSKLCFQICREAYGEPLWMYLRYRENIHLYIARYGKEWVKNFRFSEGSRGEEVSFVK